MSAPPGPVTFLSYPSVLSSALVALVYGPVIEDAVAYRVW
jgi:hypothetical protein